MATGQTYDYRYADRTVSEIAELEGLNDRTVHKNIKRFPNDSIERIIARIISNQPQQYSYKGRKRKVAEIARYIGVSDTRMHSWVHDYGIKKAIKLAEALVKKRGHKVIPNKLAPVASKNKCNVKIPGFNPLHQAENLYTSLVNQGYEGEELERQFKMRVAA